MAEIKQTIATKDDLKAVENRLTAVEQTMATKDDLKKVEKRIIKRLDHHFHFLDKELMADHNRLDRLEDHLELPRLQP